MNSAPRLLESEVNGMASKSRVAWVGLWGWICLSLFAGTGVSGQEFFVSSETATVGAQFQVTVSIQAPTPTAGFNFDLCHDTAVLRLVSAAVVPAISAQADLDQVSFFDGNTPCDPVANPGCSDNVSVAVVAAQNPLDASAQLDVFVVTYELLATIPGGSTAIMICDGGSIPVASINDAAGMPFTLINGGMAQGTVMEPVGACIAPVNLLCGMVTGGVELNWVNASVYDTITVSDQAGFVATVAGTATTFTDLNPGVGALSYTVTGNCSSPPGGSATSATCLVQMIELSADNVVAGGGQTIVEVPVRLTFGAGVVLGGQFGMLYDNARLQLIEVVAGADFPTMETIIFQEAMTGAPIMSGLTVTFIADDGLSNAENNMKHCTFFIAIFYTLCKQAVVYMICH